MLPLNYMDKIPATVLSNSPQSDIFPSMIKISPHKPENENNVLVKQKPQKIVDNKLSKQMLIAVGLGTIGGVVIGRGTAGMIERPIDNFPAGLIGATVFGAGMLSTVGFYIAKYGGFFDKDRDFRTMFKNL